jgi:hypothetical protein
MKLAQLALLALLSAPPAVMIGAPVAAQTQSDCQTQITNLRTASSTVAISGRNADKDRAGLVDKLGDASAELTKGKNADAVKKLTDFKVKVQQLVEAGRLSASDATSLNSQADSAIACLNGLSAG